MRTGHAENLALLPAVTWQYLPLKKNAIIRGIHDKFRMVFHVFLLVFSTRSSLLGRGRSSSENHLVAAPR